MRKNVLFGLLTCAALAGCGAAIPAPTSSDLAALDCDRSGGLSQQEVGQLWINHSGSLFAAAAQRAVSAGEFTRADQNGDKSLSLAELAAIVTTAGNGWGYARGCR
jgi:hypothetical protein